MTFEDLGALLRSEREKKNLNITDIASQLKINPRHLRAIEDGDMSALPHPAYVRGFVRSYAGLLGLSQEEVQEILDNLPGTNTVKPKKLIKNAQNSSQRTPSSHTGWKIFIALCVIAAALYYLWDAGYLDFLKKWQKSDETHVSELQSADRYMAAKDAEKAKRDSTPIVPPAPLEESHRDRILPLPGAQAIPAPSVSEPEPVLPKSQAALGETTSREDAILPSVPPETNPQESQEAANPGQHKLIITAVEECWIHSNADKTDTRQFSLRKGDTFALTFADSLELKLGNAGGVRLRYDGSDLPAPGSSGQVRTLTFPPKNNS